MQINDSICSRLDKYTDKTDSCWVWVGYKNKHGYGMLMVNKKLTSAHRLNFYRYIENPIGKCVLHRCDNPSCVNPDHLWLGTHKENTKDMIQKGRQNPKYGEATKATSISKEIIISIRNDNISNSRELSEKYNISRSQAHKIKTNKTRIYG